MATSANPYAIQPELKNCRSRKLTGTESIIECLEHCDCESAMQFGYRRYCIEQIVRLLMVPERVGE